MATSFSNRRFFFFLPGLLPSRMRVLFSKTDFLKLELVYAYGLLLGAAANLFRQGVDYICDFRGSMIGMDCAARRLIAEWR